MRHSFSSCVIVLVLVALHGSSPAAEGPGAPVPIPATNPSTQRSARADSLEIGPYLQDTTVAVIRVDVASLKTQAFRDWAVQVLRRAEVPQEQIDEYQRQFRGGLAQIENWQAGFTRAGGRRMYGVINLPFMTNLPYFVVPLEPGADAEAIAAQLEATEMLTIKLNGSPAAPDTAPSTSPSDREEKEARRGLIVRAARVGNVVVYGTTATIERLQQQQRANAAGTPHELEQAMQAVADSPIALAAASGDSVRQQLEPFLGKDSALMTMMGKWRWLAVSVTMPPGPSIRATLQASSPETAKSVRDQFRKLFDVPPGERADGTITERQARALRGLVPELKDSQLTLNLDTQKLDSLVGEVARAKADEERHAAHRIVPSTRPANEKLN